MKSLDQYTHRIYKREAVQIEWDNRGNHYTKAK